VAMYYGVQNKIPRQALFFAQSYAFCRPPAITGNIGPPSLQLLLQQNAKKRKTWII